MNHMELQYFKTDKNGTKYFYDWKCPRCAGYGQAEKWRFTGLTCFACGGSGRRNVAKIVKEYTPEYWAKLEARRIARQEKYEKDHAEEIAQKKAEQDRLEAEQKRREDEWKVNRYKVIFSENGCDDNGIGYVHLGNTYPVKDQFKKNGGRWIYGSWVCPVEIKAKGVKAVKIDLSKCLEEGQKAPCEVIWDAQKM